MSTSPMPTSTEHAKRFLRQWGVMLLLVCTALVTGFVNVATHQESFSPYDEWVYYDYLVKVPEQGFVHQGEEIGEQALEAMACKGDGYGPRGEPCTGEDGVYDEPELYPQRGLTSADLYTPIYFAVTWVGAQVVSFLTGADLLTAGRAIGPIWLAAGMVFLVLLFRRWKVSSRMQIGLGLSLIGMSMIFFANTFVSTDAPSILVGAAIAYYGHRFGATGRGSVGLIVASVVGTLLKVTNILPVGLVLIALAIAWFIGNRPPISTLRFFLVPAVATIASVAAEVAWLLFRSLNAVGEGPDQGMSGVLSEKGIVATVFVFLTRSGIGQTSTWPDLASAPFALLLIAGVVGWFVVEHGRDQARAWSSATFIAAFAFAPMLLIAMSILLGATAPITPRYAIALLPMFLVAIAAITRNRIAEWLILLYGVGMIGASILGLNP